MPASTINLFNQQEIISPLAWLKSGAAKKLPVKELQKALKQVDTLIVSQLDDFSPVIKPCMADICQTQGKRIRPTLTLLMAGAIDDIGEEHIRLAAILELIHVASLVHDDVIDKADIRRGEKTSHEKWGNNVAVLLGDALFAQALLLSSGFTQREVARRIGEVARDLCQGEIEQSFRCFDLEMSETDYIEIIGKKTGLLFAAATGLSALISEVDEHQQQQLFDYGMNIGIAYQIYDDCLDLLSDEASQQASQKTLNTDLDKGKLTWPIIKIIEYSSAEQQAYFTKGIEDQQPLDLELLKQADGYQQGLQLSVDKGLAIINQARTNIQSLKESPYQLAIQEITNYIESLLLEVIKKD